MKISDRDLSTEATAFNLTKALDLDPQVVQAARQRALIIRQRMDDRAQSELNSFQGGSSNDQD